jgi:hypothetical protein
MLWLSPDVGYRLVSLGRSDRERSLSLLPSTNSCETSNSTVPNGTPIGLEGNPALGSAPNSAEPCWATANTVHLRNSKLSGTQMVSAGGALRS